MVGLAILSGVLHSEGERTWSVAAASLFGVATILWLVNIGFRVGVAPWAASELSRTGEVPPVYLATQGWMGLLFAAFMVMAYCAMAVYGVALLRTPVVARWAAWTATCFGIVAVPGLATPLFQPPLMVFVAPFVIGLAILRAT